MPNGNGRLISEHGFYLGQFKDGRFHGTGSFTFRGGDKYEGDFDSGLMHGTGQFFYKKGDIYSG